MAIQDHSVGHAQETDAQAADVPELRVPEEFDRNADPRVRVNIGGESEEASHWQLMQRQSAQNVGELSSKIDSVVVSLNHILKQGLGEAKAKYQVALLGICMEFNSQRHSTKFPNT